MKTLAAIPCHNEGLTIGSVVLKARKYVDLVLVIDDGSADDTVDVAESAGAVVVLHEKNTGYGAAVRSCFDYAKEYGFDVMTILDGGGQECSCDVGRAFSGGLELPDARYNLDVGSGSGGHGA